MPLGFPSHQGLLAPLWRRWPERFSVLALWVGAIAPDIVDGTENIFVRGHFQQWIGHTLVGTTLLGVPVALALTAGIRHAARRLATGRERGGPLRRVCRRCCAWLVAIDNPSSSASAARRLGFEAWSAWIGAVSHAVIDMLSHERSRLLWPVPDPDWLGSWWRSAWFHVSAPGYPDYPIGPHFVGWLVLSALGIYMFVRWPPARRS